MLIPSTPFLYRKAKGRIAVRCLWPSKDVSLSRIRTEHKNVGCSSVTLKFVCYVVTWVVSY
jgi:hypothetical protein